MYLVAVTYEPTKERDAVRIFHIDGNEWTGIYNRGALNTKSEIPIPIEDEYASTQQAGQPKIYA